MSRVWVLLGLLACAPEKNRLLEAPWDLGAAPEPILDSGPGLLDATEPSCQLADLQLRDCTDEATFSLQDLCAAPAGLLFNFYGWCASCHRYLEHLESFYERFEPLGLEMFILISEDALETPASSLYCQQITEHFQLRARVVLDLNQGVEARYGGADLLLITDAQGQLLLQSDSSSPEAVESLLESLLLP